MYLGRLSIAYFTIVFYINYLVITFSKKMVLHMKEVSKENKYSRELNTVLKFSALINSSLKIESVLNNAMKYAEEFINAEASSIFELDDENNELFIRLARGEKKEPIKNIRLKLGEGIAGWVVQSGRPIVVHDVQKEKKFSDKYDKLTGFKTRSLICVPLILRGATHWVWKLTPPCCASASSTMSLIPWTPPKSPSIPSSPSPAPRPPGAMRSSSFFPLPSFFLLSCLAIIFSFQRIRFIKYYLKEKYV
jgi:putative methionine-R-sulfoxide reductase with GAF domain